MTPSIRVCQLQSYPCVGVQGCTDLGAATLVRVACGGPQTQVAAVLFVVMSVASGSRDTQL